jgi:hypothetical protein
VFNCTLQLFFHCERAPVPIEKEDGWASEPVWTFLKGGKSFVLARIETPDHPAHSIDAMSTTLLWLQKKELQPLNIVYIFCYQFIGCSSYYSMNHIIH